MTTDQATTTAARIDAVADAAVATASIPPRLTGPRVIDNELIDAVANGHCGWSRKQLEILGVPWPAQSGWRQRLVIAGRTLTAEEVEALYAVGKKPKRPEGADNPESPLVPMPCPWCRRLVEPVTQGGRTKEFCCKRHKNLYNAALNRVLLGLLVGVAENLRLLGLCLMCRCQPTALWIGLAHFKYGLKILNDLILGQAVRNGKFGPDLNEPFLHTGEFQQVPGALLRALYLFAVHSFVGACAVSVFYIFRNKRFVSRVLQFRHIVLRRLAVRGQLLQIAPRSQSGHTGRRKLSAMTALPSPPTTTSDRRAKCQSSRRRLF